MFFAHCLCGPSLFPGFAGVSLMAAVSVGRTAVWASRNSSRMLRCVAVQMANSDTICGASLLQWTAYESDYCRSGECSDTAGV